jgi:hypothetical protein
MNISKHMEAIFLAAAALACVTTYADAATRPAPAKVAFSDVQGVQTVTITAKRLDNEKGV